MLCDITKTHLLKYIKILQPKKKKKNQIKILIFLMFLLKTDCMYSLELPQLGGSNEYPQSMF